MARKRILLVDDEPALVGLLSIRLEANGYEVIPAADGQQALELARKEIPDLVILDLMLPGLDGYKVCRLLKSDEQYKQIPIMILTARAQESDKKLGEQSGADAYIIKPFEPGFFLSKVRELIK